MAEEDRNTGILRLECYCVLSNQGSLSMKSLDTPIPCTKQRVSLELLQRLCTPLRELRLSIFHGWLHSDLK